MAKPRSPELARSGNTAVDPDAPAGTAPLQPDVGTAGAADHLGPVPPRNQPRRSTRSDQDKPDLTAFARRLGIGRRTTRPDADTSTVADTAPSRWARLAGLPVAATSLSLRATEAALRRSADTIAALRQRLRSDDPAS
jgi:hypothetical protein